MILLIEGAHLFSPVLPLALSRQKGLGRLFLLLMAPCRWSTGRAILSCGCSSGAADWAE